MLSAASVNLGWSQSGVLGNGLKSVYLSAGMFCQTTGLSAPTGLCYASYYCDGGSDTPTPTGSGGGFCTAGFFCPEGSTEMTPCTPGSYCASDYLNTTSGLCQAGYYCTSAATMPNPTDGTTGKLKRSVLMLYPLLCDCLCPYAKIPITR